MDSALLLFCIGTMIGFAIGIAIIVINERKLLRSVKISMEDMDGYTDGIDSVFKDIGFTENEEHGIDIPMDT